MAIQIKNKYLQRLLKKTGVVSKKTGGSSNYIKNIIKGGGAKCSDPLTQALTKRADALFKLALIQSASSRIHDSSSSNSIFFESVSDASTPRVDIKQNIDNLVQNISDADFSYDLYTSDSSIETASTDSSLKSIIVTTKEIEIEVGDGEGKKNIKLQYYYYNKDDDSDDPHAIRAGGIKWDEYDYKGEFTMDNGVPFFVAGKLTYQDGSVVYILNGEIVSENEMSSAIKQEKLIDQNDVTKSLSDDTSSKGSISIVDDDSSTKGLNQKDITQLKAIDNLQSSIVKPPISCDSEDSIYNFDGFRAFQDVQIAEENARLAEANARLEKLKYEKKLFDKAYIGHRSCNNVRQVPVIYSKADKSSQNVSNDGAKSSQQAENNVLGSTIARAVEKSLSSTSSAEEERNKSGSTVTDAHTVDDAHEEVLANTSNVHLQSGSISTVVPETFYVTFTDDTSNGMYTAGKYELVSKAADMVHYNTIATNKKQPLDKIIAYHKDNPDNKPTRSNVVIQHYISAGSFNHTYTTTHDGQVFRILHYDKRGFVNYTNEMYGLIIQYYFSQKDTCVQHVCKVYDFGTVTYNNGRDRRYDLPYAIIEKADYTMGHLFTQNTNLPLTTFKQLYKQLYEAITCIHNKGFIHSDIKPANVGIVADKQANTLRPILFDFGLAGAIGSSSCTRGTTRYRPHNDKNKCLPERDYYAYGIMLLETLFNIKIDHKKHFSSNFTNVKQTLNHLLDTYKVSEKYKTMCGGTGPTEDELNKSKAFISSLLFSIFDPGYPIDTSWFDYNVVDAVDIGVEGSSEHESSNQSKDLSQIIARSVQTGLDQRSQEASIASQNADLSQIIATSVKTALDQKSQGSSIDSDRSIVSDLTNSDFSINGSNNSSNYGASTTRALNQPCGLLLVCPSSKKVVSILNVDNSNNYRLLYDNNLSTNKSYSTFNDYNDAESCIRNFIAHIDMIINNNTSCIGSTTTNTLSSLFANAFMSAIKASSVVPTVVPELGSGSPIVPGSSESGSSESGSAVVPALELSSAISEAVLSALSSAPAPAPALAPALAPASASASGLSSAISESVLSALALAPAPAPASASGLSSASASASA